MRSLRGGSQRWWLARQGAILVAVDIVTQGLLGGAAALAGARPQETKAALAVGFFSGLLADADVLIRSSSDPLLTIEYHRHFTHSLLFIPVGALLAALLLRPFTRSHLSRGQLYKYAFMGYATSGLLDACTSYGTMLLWPFSDARIAWGLIAVVDPLFSLILLVALAIGLRKAAVLPARVGLACAGLYLLAGMSQHQRAQGLASDLASERGHQVLRHVVKPTMANLVLWRSVYETEQRIYVDAIRIGPFSEPRIYPGEQTKKFVPAEYASGLDSESALANDITRFVHFAGGFAALDPADPTVLTDARYSPLPTSLQPLWGIKLNRADPTKHSAFLTFRDFSADAKERFVAMLLGRSLSRGKTIEN